MIWLDCYNFCLECSLLLRDKLNSDRLLERDMAHNIAVYDLSLRGAVETLRQLGTDMVSPEIRLAAVFDRAAAAEYLGSLVVLDADGNIAADSTLRWTPFVGSPALCVDCGGGRLMVGAGGLPFHLMVHDRLHSHAGLPR